MFQREAPTLPQVTRTELYKRVTYEYLGFGTQGLEKLKAEEEAMEEKLRKAKYQEAAKKRRKIEEGE